MSVIAELKRRNVFRVAALYLVAAWVLLQVGDLLVGLLSLPSWANKLLFVALVLGFVPALIFSWVYELTPEGLKREHEVERNASITAETARKLDLIVVGLLVIAIVVVAVERFIPRTAPIPAATEAASEASSAKAPVQAAAKSIAVLPFVNMSSDTGNEYFADGLSEELLNLLAKLPELQVIARTSSFAFKGEKIDIAEIAKRLNVAHVLEGSVRKSGNTVRITAQLVRASDRSHLWSQTYDRQMTDVFKVQDEIAAAVVSELKIKLLGAAPTTKVTDPKAYAFFLQAREISVQFSPAALEQAIALYQQVLALDPGYAPAWVGLADTYLRQIAGGLRLADEGTRLARQATTKALSIDPQYAPAHAVLGVIAIVYDRDLAAAAQHVEHALALEPANPDSINLAGFSVRRLGRLDQAIAIGEHVITVDPVNSDAYDDLGFSYFYAGRFDDAIAMFRTELRLSPGSILRHESIAEALLLKGDATGALAENKHEADDASRLLGLSMIYRALGQEAQSDAALRELVERHENTMSYGIAYALAYRGEADHAFEWLDRAVRYHDQALGSIADHPMFANIHSDPRWLPFLRKLGVAPEQLAAIKFDVKVPN